MLAPCILSIKQFLSGNTIGEAWPGNTVLWHWNVCKESGVEQSIPDLPAIYATSTFRGVTSPCLCQKYGQFCVMISCQLIKHGSQKAYGEYHGTSKRWKQDTTGPVVHPLEIWSLSYDLVKMWTYTLQTPMNIYKKTVFREWLLWWKMWKTLTEKGETRTFSFLHWAILPRERLWVPWHFWMS